MRIVCTCGLFGLMALAFALALDSALALPSNGEREAAPRPDDKPRPVTAEEAEFFEKRVRPVLAENCWSCHGDKVQKADLRLDSRAALLKGTGTRAVVEFGDPDKSRFLKAIRHDGDVKMPSKAPKLAEEQIEALTAWIRMGAPWPGGDIAKPDPAAEAWKKHWAFQPVKMPRLPEVKNRAWAQTPVDAFILAGLEAKGLSPTAAADRRSLIRRATFDLTGLPPSPEEVEAFVKDDSPRAFAQLVDRLLESPRYGERWGRHWLDAARYADERGYIGVGVDRVYPFAYTYRDWVIRAFNEDLPYDQFILLQLAADQLTLSDNPRDLAAMGFLTVGRRFINNPHDIIDDRIDVTTRAFMGLTVTCARCHDHKFDPIPTADYYSLYGVFASSHEPEDLPLLGEVRDSPEYQAFVKDLRKLEEERAAFEQANEQMKKEKPREFIEKIKPFENRIRQLQAKHPGAPPRGMVMLDNPKPANARIFLRGNPANPGPEAPRQFPRLIEGKGKGEGEGRKPFANGSGRLEMARAIADADNPLTARVLVNRIWMHHFGRGIVRTPSDFGMRSESPSHPELLDYLAVRFVENGWSIKKLHRLIMLSSVYQMATASEALKGVPAESDAAGMKADPENFLLWTMNRRRLDFEQLGDSILFVSGGLDSKLGGPSVDIVKPPYSKRRTVYGFIDRQNLPGLYRVFDFASPDAHSPMRYVTTVPQQALFLLNSPFMVERVKALTGRREFADLKEPDGRIQAVYRLVYQRAPTAVELKLGLEFLRKGEGLAPDKGDAGLTVWERYVQVLLLSNEFAFVD